MSHLWVTLGSVCPSHFESLLGHFDSFCAAVELGGRPLHKVSVFVQAIWPGFCRTNCGPARRRPKQVWERLYPVTRNDCENHSLRILFFFFFGSFEGLCTLKISGKERHFHRITCEIRNFWKIIISETFFISNHFVSDFRFWNIFCIVFTNWKTHVSCQQGSARKCGSNELP